MIRALLFTVAFYTATVVILVGGSWLLLAPRSWAMAGLAFHARVSLWLLKVIVGTRLEVRGSHNLPDGPALIASKHQSAWDTFALVPLLRDPAIVMKQELMWIPLYGWFSYKFRMIPVEREAGPAALRQMARAARDRAAARRHILIFPEGTRRSPGAEPAYKPGVLFLYSALGLPCVPVALNSGLYWPRRSLRRYPGTIVVEFLEPIPAGLPRDEFETRLVTAIETATARLIEDALHAPNPPPLPAGAVHPAHLTGARS